MVIKWGLVSNVEECVVAEKTIYANVMRKVIQMRGRTTLLRKRNDDVDFVEIDINSVTNDEISPENGFFLFGHNIPINGLLSKDKGRTVRILSFKETIDNKWATPLRWSWTASVIVPKNVINDEQAIFLNAKLSDDGLKYFIRDLPFDFSDVAQSYAWESIVDDEPEFKIFSE